MEKKRTEEEFNVGQLRILFFFGVFFVAFHPPKLVTLAALILFASFFILKWFYLYKNLDVKPKISEIIQLALFIILIVLVRM
jgi:hypothetical protein